MSSNFLQVAECIVQGVRNTKKILDIMPYFDRSYCDRFQGEMKTKFSTVILKN